MFPKTQEVIEVVFRQVLSNYVGEIDSAPTRAKIHAEVTSVLHVLYGDFVDSLEITHTPYSSYLEVHFNAEDPYIAWAEYSWVNGTITKGFA